MVVSLFNLRSDIILILQKSKVSKDSRIAERHIEFLIHKYRAVAIRQQYSKTSEYAPEWLQDTGRIVFTRVNSAEDPLITCTSRFFGKYTLPSILSLPEDAGLYRVSSSSHIQTYYPIQAWQLFELVDGSDRARCNYFTRIGNAIYTYPNAQEGNIVFIPENPLDVPVLETEDVNALIIGQRYVVLTGNITSDGTTYYASLNNTFTATAESFTGTGRVQFVNQRRARTNRDYYHVGINLAEFISMKIFTQDFKIEEKEIGDTKNDAQDQLLVLQNLNRGD